MSVDYNSALVTADRNHRVRVAGAAGVRTSAVSTAKLARTVSDAATQLAYEKAMASANSIHRAMLSSSEHIRKLDHASAREDLRSGDLKPFLNYE